MSDYFKVIGIHVLANILVLKAMTRKKSTLLIHGYLLLNKIDWPQTLQIHPASSCRTVFSFSVRVITIKWTRKERVIGQIWWNYDEAVAIRCCIQIHHVTQLYWYDPHAPYIWYSLLKWLQNAVHFLFIMSQNCTFSLLVQQLKTYSNWTWKFYCRLSLKITF